MSHVLITGGAGFIGSTLSDSLLRDGYRVTALDNFDPFYPADQKMANIAAQMQNPKYALRRADIRSPEELSNAVPDDVTIIVHLAAKAGVRPSIESPLDYQATNVAGTHHLLELARVREIRQFVFASSSSVYGVNPDVPWRETCTPLPISPYASTKLSGEYLGHVYSHLFGLRFIALRFFTVYGPRQRPDLAIRKFAERMLRGERVSLFGDGSTSRDYTFVGDTVRGIRAAIEYRSSAFEVINLGNCRTVSLSRMVEVLSDVLGVTPLIDRLPEQPGDVPITFADISRAKCLLDYDPATPFEDGIAMFVKWIRESQRSLTTAG